MEKKKNAKNVAKKKTDHMSNCNFLQNTNVDIYCYYYFCNNYISVSTN